MIVPEYWAEARTTRRAGKRQVTLRRFGWSDESELAAQRHAEERVKEAFAQLDSGEKPTRREPKVPYNGAEGVPIREEIIERHGDIIITRNAYGALCLNTPDVLFADVDVQRQPGAKTNVLSCLVLLIIGFVMVGIAMGAGLIAKPWIAFLSVVIVSAFLFHTVARVAFKFLERTQGSPEEQALARVRTFSQRHPGCHLRVYSTPAGLRVLAMHATFGPNAPETMEFFGALKTDPIYVRMCQRQNCFRARVSPKPWRVGYGTHLKPRPGVWPINPDRLPDRVRWVEGYEKASVGFAACRFVERLGAGTVDPKAERVRSWHDQYSGADTGLALA